MGKGAMNEMLGVRDVGRKTLGRKGHDFGAGTGCCFHLIFESHHSWANGNPFLWGFSMMETQP